MEEVNKSRLLIKVIDVSDIGWDTFRDENHGDYLIYSKHDKSAFLFYAARVSIPEIEDGFQRMDQTVTEWIIERYEQSDYDLRVDGKFVNKETFISKLSERYPDDLTWLLFHPDWLL
jgi:hypothetical protein